MAKQKSILVVLGMHRSGTSVATRMFNLLGASPGKNLLVPAADNPTGFWEPVDIVAAHDALLLQLGYSWDDPRPLPHNWWDRPEMVTFEEQLCQLAEKHYSDAEQPIIKDPRICRLLPIWQKIFKRLGWQHNYILVGRSPLEVAGSLAKRDNFAVNLSYMLWLRHVIESEKWSRGHPRAFLQYNQLFGNWKTEIERCLSELDLKTLHISESRESEINNLIDASLRHNKSTEDSINTNPELSLFIADAYRGLQQAATASRDENKIQTLFDKIGQQLMVADNLFSPIWQPYLTCTDELRAVQSDLEHYRGVAQAQKNQLTELFDKVQSLAAKLNQGEH